MLKLLAVVAIVAVVLSVSKTAFAQTIDLSNDVEVTDVQSHAWIFVTSPDKYCERDVSALQADLLLQRTYLPYVGSYDVVCFPSGGDVMQVRQNVALIRTVYPHDKLVFTYDLRNPALARDFRLFLSTVDSYNHKDSLGKSFITEGWAVSTFAGEVAAHELTHLTTGKDHPPGTDMNNPATWIVSQDNIRPLRDNITIKENQKTEDTQVMQDSLKQYTLDLINKDRADNKLPPVTLSNNIAAQVHADDVFSTKQISHWMTNGEKPYMTYSRLGGVGYVVQNVATWETTQDHKTAIKGLEDSMMNDDLICCNNGHRDNILDPYHTSVSIGITFDDSYIVIVENFENNYITKEPTGQAIFDYTDEKLHVNARINNAEVKERETSQYTSGNVIYSTFTVPILIYYDPASTSSEYAIHSKDKSYSQGTPIACVVQNVDDVKCSSIQTVLADRWYYTDSSQYDDISLTIDLRPVFSQDGVYTVVIYGEPPNSAKDDSDVPSWPILTYSIDWEGNN